jgi:hypothetical protein
MPKLSTIKTIQKKAARKMSENFREVVELLERHAQRLHEDVNLCRTRDEHIRVTARTNEAYEIYRKLTGVLSTE